MAILKAGGVPHLVALLRQGPYSEHTEYAAAVLGNLAAGGQALKDAIREARHFHTLHARQGAIVWQLLAGLEDANLRLFLGQVSGLSWTYHSFHQGALIGIQQDFRQQN